jgi:transketolase
LEGGIFTHYLLEAGSATVFPQAMAIGATGRDEDAYDVARTIGIEARVLDMHTVKPIDTQAIERAANETSGIVVAEEHLAYGGLGSVVAMVVAEHHPVPMAFVDLGDTYATSGTTDELLAQFGLTPPAIQDACRRVLK